MSRCMLSPLRGAAGAVLLLVLPRGLFAAERESVSAGTFLTCHLLVLSLHGIVLAVIRSAMNCTMVIAVGAADCFN